MNADTSIRPCRTGTSSGTRDPALRAVGALATSVPLYLLLFAATYYVMGGISVLNFQRSHHSGIIPPGHPVRTA